MCFYRLTAHFIVQIGQGELRKQWAWEPRMGESLILSLVDPNDVSVSSFYQIVTSPLWFSSIDNFNTFILSLSCN